MLFLTQAFVLAGTPALDRNRVLLTLTHTLPCPITTKAVEMDDLTKDPTFVYFKPPSGFNVPDQFLIHLTHVSWQHLLLCCMRCSRQSRPVLPSLGLTFSHRMFMPNLCR